MAGWLPLRPLSSTSRLKLKTPLTTTPLIQPPSAPLPAPRGAGGPPECRSCSTRLTYMHNDSQRPVTRPHHIPALFRAHYCGCAAKNFDRKLLERIERWLLRRDICVVTQTRGIFEPHMRQIDSGAGNGWDELTCSGLPDRRATPLLASTSPSRAACHASIDNTAYLYWSGDTLCDFCRSGCNRRALSMFS